MTSHTQHTSKYYFNENCNTKIKYYIIEKERIMNIRVLKK